MEGSAQLAVDLVLAVVIGWGSSRARGACWAGPAGREPEPAEEKGSPGPGSRSALIMALFQAMRLPQMLSSSSCTSDLPEQKQARIGAMLAMTSLFVDSTVSIFRACCTVGAS